MSKFLGLIALLAATIQVSSAVLTQQEALQLLQDGGISANTYCLESNNSLCPSLEGIRQDTINGLLNLKKRSGCEIMVNGGIETILKEEETDSYSHKKGFWATVDGNQCVDKYILSSMKCERKYTSTNKVEYLLCEDASSNFYFYSFLEKRWDIAFFPESNGTEKRQKKQWQRSKLRH